MTVINGKNARDQLRTVSDEAAMITTETPINVRGAILELQHSIGVIVAIEIRGLGVMPGTLKSLKWCWKNYQKVMKRERDGNKRQREE